MSSTVNRMVGGAAVLLSGYHIQVKEYCNKTMESSKYANDGRKKSGA